MISPLVWSGLVFLGTTLVVVLVSGIYLRYRRAKKALQADPESQSLQHRPIPQSPPVASEAGCSLLFAVAWISFSVLVMVMATGAMITSWQRDVSGDSSVVILFLGCFALMTSLFGLIGLWMLMQSGQTISRAWLLTRRGKMTQAIIIDRWIDKDTGGDTISCVAYRFSVPGKPDIETAEYNRAAFNRYQINDTATVQYLPHQPDICRLVLYARYSTNH